MKINYIVAAMLLTSAIGASAQTQLVAHRSHGGRNESFTAGRGESFGGYVESDDVGKPAMKVVIRVTRLSDTTAAEESNFGSDTTLHHPFWNNPGIHVDSLRKLFPSISFEGYPEDNMNAQARSNSRSEHRTAAVGMPAEVPTGGGLLRLALLTTGIGGVLAVGTVTAWRRKTA